MATYPLLLDKMLAALSRYSLIRRDIENRTFDIHRLVQAVIQDRMDEGTRCLHAERAVRALNAAFPFVEYSNWPQCARLLPHVLLCAAHIDTYQFTFDEAARLLNQAGYYLEARAQYVEAEPLYVRALEIYGKVVGPDHPSTATSLNNLASLYNNQGRYEEVELLLVRALAIKEIALGSDHPDTALGLNNLAGLYKSQGRYEQAEPLYERALAIYEKVLGPQHPSTVIVRENYRIFQQRMQQKANPPRKSWWQKLIGGKKSDG